MTRAQLFAVANGYFNAKLMGWTTVIGRNSPVVGSRYGLQRDSITASTAAESSAGLPDDCNTSARTTSPVASIVALIEAFPSMPCSLAAAGYFGFASRQANLSGGAEVSAKVRPPHDTNPAAQSISAVVRTKLNSIAIAPSFWQESSKPQAFEVFA
nr:hypothetical protein [Cupriavidus basilensis]